MSNKVDLKAIDLKHLEDLEELDSFVGGKVFDAQQKVTKMKLEEDQSNKSTHKRSSLKNR